MTSWNWSVPRGLDHFEAKIRIATCHSAPGKDPEAKDEACHNREHNCHKEINKEGHKCPTDEGDHHDEENEHVGGEPGNEQGSVVHHDAQEEEKGEEEVEDPSRKESNQQMFVVVIYLYPCETLPHRMCNL